MYYWDSNWFFIERKQIILNRMVYILWSFLWYIYRFLPCNNVEMFSFFFSTIIEFIAINKWISQELSKKSSSASYSRMFLTINITLELFIFIFFYFSIILNLFLKNYLAFVLRILCAFWTDMRNIGFFLNKLLFNELFCYNYY